MIAAWLSLPPLAWLQYQWIGRISQAERERLQADLDTSVSRFHECECHHKRRCRRPVPPGAARPVSSRLAQGVRTQTTGFPDRSQATARAPAAAVSPRAATRSPRDVATIWLKACGFAMGSPGR